MVAEEGSRKLVNKWLGAGGGALGTGLLQAVAYSEAAGRGTAVTVHLAVTKQQLTNSVIANAKKKRPEALILAVTLLMGNKKPW